MQDQLISRLRRSWRPSGDFTRISYVCISGAAPPLPPLFSLVTQSNLLLLLLLLFLLEVSLLSGRFPLFSLISLGFLSIYSFQYFFLLTSSSSFPSSLPSSTHFLFSSGKMCVHVYSKPTFPSSNCLFVFFLQV